METTKKSKKNLSETDVEALIKCNQMLKEHLDYLRAKLSKTEAILEMCIKAVEQEEKGQQNAPNINIFSLN
jgi:hypothetical protein